jgi:hypothetical protein
LLNTTEELIGVVILFLIGSKKAKASTTGKNPDDDAASLLARANQHMSIDWIALFENEGEPAAHADAWARWAALESSGNPRKVSTLGERGLFQLGAAAQKDGALTDVEWSALLNPATTNQQHAHMALRQANWLWHRASKKITDPPDGVNAAEDFESGVWYAYLEQQWPADVTKALHGPALPMARELAVKWQNDPKRMHRLRAANVVAFGEPNP